MPAEATPRWADQFARNPPPQTPQVPVLSQIDQVILLNQAGRNTHEHICESLELFAREVVPEFRALEPQHEEWKQAVLAGDLRLEEIDTEPHNFARGRAASKT